VWDLMHLAWSSVAALAIAPLQDLLNLGPEARMNVPGRPDGNWTWRCTEDMLLTPAFQSLRELTKSSNRMVLRSPLTIEVAQVELAQETKNGQSSPLGATLSPEGVNFSVYSKHATAIDLLLFDSASDGRPTRVIRLDPASNRTYHYWHVFVPGVKAGQIYAYRVEGPFDPANGMRFDSSKVLIDPYGRCVVAPENYSREAAGKAGDNAASAMKTVVVDSHAYDWEGDKPLNRPSSRTIVYE